MEKIVHVFLQVVELEVDNYHIVAILADACYNGWEWLPVGNVCLLTWQKLCIAAKNCNILLGKVSKRLVN